MEMSTELVSCWEQIILDHRGDVHFVEPNPGKKLTESLSIGCNITEKLQWFRLEWLNGTPMSRIVLKHQYRINICWMFFQLAKRGSACFFVI